MNAVRKFRQIHLTTAEILVLGFALVILIGALLLNLPFASKSGDSVGFVNALFTAASSVAVTGLVVVDTLTHWTTFGHVVILILIQIGGLGIITMGTLFALIIGRRITFRQRVVMQEAMNKITVGGVVRLARYILIMTFVVEGIGAIILATRFIPIYGVGQGIWLSVFHSVSAFCNAGFDLIGNFQSLTPFVNDPVVTLTVAMLIIIGGLGFVVIFELLEKKSLKRLSLHSKIAISMTAFLLVLGYIIVLALEFNNPETMGNLSIGGKLLSGFFHSVTPRTAGFNTLPMDKLMLGTIVMTMIFMFIGAGTAGTAGGVKVTTVGVIVASIVSTLKGRKETESFNRKLPRDLVNKSLAIITLAMLWVITVIFILSITEDAPLQVIVFEAISAFGTVGLSLGITTQLSVVGKLVITITMFVGRIGPLTLFMALAQRRQVTTAISYPDEEIMIG
ncbi:TrkH family potassium uptake protein [Candidatus Xianfuyuplasma coldseepsis]|uniref:Trk family potassium uptake protein n=1 Tax=Candidatus Xianfuyuplasma coldseepsis TaxID=2782163 RepID=A0A7L7KQX2_9MOLU|nr:TrkH family potassium uptake protein [Xianfuyuplasma coldseepsis]QMS84682.1 Trk family potassium uptake protein [Xianfuyuplasma coldseepsis]